MLDGTTEYLSRLSNVLFYLAEQAGQLQPLILHKGPEFQFL